MKHRDNKGREELLEYIIDMVHHNAIILNGVRKIGETPLLPQLEKRLSKPFIFVYVDLEDAESEEEFFRKITSRVVDVCRSHLDISELRQITGHYTIAFAEVLDVVIRRLNGQKSLVLLLDGVDTTKIYIQEALHYLRSLLMKFYRQLRLIMAGVIVHEDPYMFSSPWWNVFHYIDVTPFAEENAKPVKSLVQKLFDSILHRNKSEK